MPKTILIAEDDVFLSKFIKASLSQEGFEIITVGDGKLVLPTIKTTTPHLIILDVILPNLNGFEILKLLKDDPTISNIPVLVSTVLSTEKDVNKLHNLGAYKCFIKTRTQFDELVSEVKNILNEKTPI